MPRAGLSPTAVVDAVLGFLDTGGAEPTLAAVAARCGVSTPSLYKHVRNLAELRALVALRVLGELTELLTTAGIGRSGDEAVAALMHAWRDYVCRYPQRYAMIALDPLTDPALAAAAARQVTVIRAVLGAYLLEPSDEIHAVRRLRAATHGFALLEVNGGFGLLEDVDESFQQVIDMVAASLRSAP